MARIGEIQARFGVSSSPGLHRVGVEDFSGFTVDEVVDLVTDETKKIAGDRVATQVEATLLDALSVHRGDVGIAGAASAHAAGMGETTKTVFDGVLTNPLAGHDFGSGYGMRVHPIDGVHKMHRGVDIGAAEGTPIVAAADGRVTWAGPRGTYGNLVVIEHDDRTETRYAHQSEVFVKAGDSVRANQPIGAVGSTGASTGPHLHFEVRVDGDAVDPEGWIQEDAR